MQKIESHKQLLVQFMPFNFHPIFQSQESWTPSDYGQNGNRLQNQEIRKSEYRFAVGLGLSNLPTHNSNSQGKWRIICYKNGKFIQHEDEQKKANHMGTQILIFPKSKSPHQKGSLIIRNPKNKNQTIQVEAQESVYIYVFIPLGYLHEITEVEGVRTVATRMVTDEKKQHYIQKVKNNDGMIFID